MYNAASMPPENIVQTARGSFEMGRLDGDLVSKILTRDAMLFVICAVY
jgi:hypothetical protein